MVINKESIKKLNEHEIEHALIANPGIVGFTKHDGVFLFIDEDILYVEYKPKNLCSHRTGIGEDNHETTCFKEERDECNLYKACLKYLKDR